MARPAISQGTPVGYIPCDIANAYRLNNSGLTGTGVTIAIVDAFDQPTIGADLHAFDQTFQLPDPPLNVLKPFGPPAQPTGAQLGWLTEITLDVEWAHALAPGATIDLVEAHSDALNDPVGTVLDAVSYVSHTLNPDVVSMSWGDFETNLFATGSDELSADQQLFPTTNGAGRPIAYVASAGDSGFGASWPAVSRSVIGVGGTSLSLGAFGYASPPGSHLTCSPTLTPGVTSANETVWGGGFCGGVPCGTGGGPSAFVSKPGWQSMAPGGTRASPDVAMLADPLSGLATFQEGQWNNFAAGGTSASAPMLAGLTALLDEGRRSHNLSNLNQDSRSLWLYATTAVDFNDITIGSSPNPTGGCGINNACVAQAGYDEVTGRGSPFFPSLATDLAGVGASAAKGNLTTLPPQRVMDTRDGTGGHPGAMQPNETFGLNLPAPASAGAAVIVNVGVTNTAGDGYALVYPCGQPKPFASTVNFHAGQTTADLTQVQIGSGCLNVFMFGGPADVFIDLQSFYSGTPSGSTGLYRPLDAPIRVMDSRINLGHTGQFQSNEGSPLEVAGNPSIGSNPAIPGDAGAITLNLTGVNGSQNTYQSVYPASFDQSGSPICPAARTFSNLNLLAGQVKANRVIVKVGHFNASSPGWICFYNFAGAIDVVADLAGWYSGGGSGDITGLLFTPWSPIRVYDSRLVSPLGPGTTPCPSADFTLPVPTAVSVVSMNLTGLNATTGTYIEAFPTNRAPNPPTSDVNLGPGDIQPNLVVTRVDAGTQSITICNFAGFIDFFADVNGVYRT